MTGARPLPGVGDSAQIVPARDATAPPPAPVSPPPDAPPAADAPSSPGGPPAPDGPPQCSRAARPSGERQATTAGPGIGITAGSATRARSASSAHSAGVAALTARVKNMPVSGADGGSSADAPGVLELVGRPLAAGRLADDQPVPGPAHRAELERLDLLVGGLAGRPPG